MPDVPNRLPEKGKTAALQRWLNQLRDVVISHRSLDSHNVRTERTAVGVYRNAIRKKADEQEPVASAWRGPWVPTNDYVVNDVVSVDDTPDFTTYSFPGLFVCTADIAGDALNNEPGADGLHWYQAVRLWHDRISVRSGQIMIDGGGAGHAATPTIKLLGDSGAFVEINSGLLAESPPDEMIIRHLVLSLDGGSTFVQGKFLCTELVAYP